MTDPVSAIIDRSGLLGPGECLRCQVCCRFPSAASPLAPFFSHDEMACAVAAGMPADAFPPGRYGPGFSARLVAHAPAFRCPAFRPISNDCAAYAARPLDCRLYPFMLLCDAGGKEVFLGLDTYCPAVAEREEPPELRAAAAELAALLDGELLGKVIASRGVVGAWNGHVRRLAPLPGLTRALCRTDLGLARLTLTARERLLPFFEAQRGAHSLHAFAPIYAWSDLFDLRWKVSGERLLIFAEGDGDCFLFCPPLGAGDIAGPAEDALATMRALAPRAASPRIQDADDESARRLAASGWRIRETHVEYLYPRAQLADLRGNDYEKKRQLCNRFEHDVKDRLWRALEPDDLPAAMALYSRWLRERTAAHPDEIYAAQAEASWRALYRSIRDAEELQLVARALEANGRTAGFTLGCPLHDGRRAGQSLGDGGTFHVMFEISDLAVKGAAQFMFRELCREMSGFERINAGSASGLDNLARAKESYRPSERLASHTLAPAQD